MHDYGDIKLNGKNYRTDLESYRMRDVVDFAPRGSTPGGAIVHSELGMYQPLLQTDWRHGFGFQWFEDGMGYLSTTGNIDTRHKGLAMMSTAATGSDTDNYRKDGFTTWNNAVWTWGEHGLRKYTGGAWAQAQDVSGTDTGSRTLNPTADTMLYKYATTTNYSSRIYLYIGEAVGYTNAVSRTLVKFDLSVIPSTATITSATLRLYMHSEASTNDRTISVYRMLKDWNDPQCTWNIYSTGNNWTTAGGFDAADCEQTDISNLAFTSTEAIGWKEFTLTATEVQEWVDGTIDNYGMLLKVDTEENDQFRFYSKEYTTDKTLIPQLVIEYTTPALSDTGVVNFALAGGEYLFYCPDGARIRKISKEGTDSVAGNDTDCVDIKWLHPYNGFIYAGVDGTNRVHRDSTKDLSDLEATTDDTDVIYVGLTNDEFPTLGAITYAGGMYISRADGLWQLGEDLVARRVLDFSSEASSDNFRGMVVHNGYLVFPIRDKLYQWNGARLSDITPPLISDTFPFTTYGRFDNLVSMGRFMYLTARTNESTYNEDLLCFDGVGFHKLARLVSNGTDTISAMGYDPINNYLWYHLDATADITYYIPFQNKSEFPYANFPTTGTHELVLSRLDMGFRKVKKSIPSILIEASNLASNRYLQVYYALDDGTWVKWSDENIMVDGITELKYPGGNQTIEFYHMKLKIVFVTGTATQSPVLEGITIRFIMRPEEVYGWSFNIPLARGMEVGESIQDRPVKNIIEDLKDARNSKSPIELIDIFGIRELVYVTAFTAQAVEADRDEGGEYPNIEHIVQVSLVQAK